MARSLNGSSDFINGGHNNTYLAPTAISISVWVKPSSLANAYSAVVSRNDGTNAYQIFVKSSGNLAWYVTTGGGTFVDPGSHTISTGAWAHLGLAYSSAVGVQTYVNAASDGTAGANGNLLNAFTTNDLTIGKDTQNAGRFFGGGVGDVGIWNVALTLAEFGALAKGARPYRIRPTALQAWLPLDGLASPEPDLTGHANNGTLTGTSLASGPPISMFTPRWPQKIETAVAAPAAQFIFTPAIIP